MNIVFMGTPDFAVPSLQTLLDEFQQVVLVVTQPDRPKGRKKVLTPPPVKVEAVKRGVPVFQPERLRDEAAIQEVLRFKPDLIVTAAYGQLLPNEILEAPRYGCINVHASLLPKYRGGAPIHHALINGETETGITLLYMVEALDAGDMLSQQTIPILPTDHVGSLHERLAKVGAELLQETLPKLIQGKIQPIPQEEAKVTYAPNITKEDEQIDWHQSATAISHQVRGLHPWPVAFTLWKGKRLKIWRAEALSTSSGQAPGTVVEIQDDGIIVATHEGCLRITELQPHGKKRQHCADFLRGNVISIGDRLGVEN